MDALPETPSKPCWGWSLHSDSSDLRSGCLGNVEVRCAENRKKGEKMERKRRGKKGQYVTSCIEGDGKAEAQTGSRATTGRPGIQHCFPSRAGSCRTLSCTLASNQSLQALGNSSFRSLCCPQVAAPSVAADLRQRRRDGGAVMGMERDGVVCFS